MVLRIEMSYFQFVVLILVLIPPRSCCFVLPPLLRHSSSRGAISNTPPEACVVPESTKTSTGALSMGLEELAVALGGMGRARLVWDCYSIGVDPQIFHDAFLRSGDESDADIQRLLPSCRRTQKLGKEALDRLSSLCQAGKVEGGVASLSHISTSADSTTKLLLKLADGLEVETVIIPWNGVRSTLCIS